MATYLQHRWIAKALLQKTVSHLHLLPAYHLGQQIGGRLRHFHPSSRIEYAGKLAADIGREHLDGASVVEIGTGWVPVLPIALHLLGVREIHSFDLTRHLMPELTLRALRRMPECLPDLARRSGAPLAELERRFAPLADVARFEELTERIGLHCHAPQDVTRSAIGPESIDVIYSNLVLEHVTPEALTSILAHSRRILKPEGRCWHNVDFTDHYSHTHRGLSAINFLRYSDGFWNVIGQNDILYQNRMRRSDYLKAFEAAGFEVVRAIDHADSTGGIGRVPLSRRFAAYPVEDLACMSARFVLGRAS